jgi:hypothetical protein
LLLTRLDLIVVVIRATASEEREHEGEHLADGAVAVMHTACASATQCLVTYYFTFKVKFSHVGF